jgi:putative ABC transport system permease protein
MIHSLVRENLRRNLLHTWAKVFAISIEVTIILSCAGIHHGIGASPSIARLNFGIYVSILLLFVFAVSFLFVAIGRYSEVQEMTHEIGILRVLGASKGYILGLLYQETLLITLLGTIAGIVMTFAAKWVVASEFPDFLTLDTVYAWWPIAGAISAAGPLLGATFALQGAIRRGLIHALSPEE